MLSQNLNSRRLAIGLAALAGFIDALGFLSLGGVFVSFMSGNSTRFAVGIIDHDVSLGLSLVPLGIIMLFVIGVMLGRGIRHFLPHRPSASIMIFMSAVLLCAGLLYEMDVPLFAACLLAIAMGAANNVFFREGEVSVGVTYMTGTLVKFGQRLAGWLLGEKDHNWLPYLLLWAGLVSGAVLGAAGYAFFGFHIVWLGVITCFALAAVFWRSESMT